jgi:autotransporter-associated beta strand protein
MKNQISPLLIGSLVAVCAHQPSTAATYNWNGGGGTWDTVTANWTGAGAVWPSVSSLDDDAVFGGVAGSVTIAAGGVTANDLTFSTTGFTISGATLTLDGSTPTITTDAAINSTISSVVSGSAGLTKAGAGTLTLSGANNFTGTTTISGGTLRAGNGAALGSNASGTTVASGATLDVNGTNLGTEIITISGTGVGGNGALVNLGAEQPNALGRMVLGNHASVGGTTRLDLRNSSPTLDLAGFSLTKKGGNYFGLVGVAVTPGTGNVIIDQGELSVQTTSNLNGSSVNSVTVNSGGTLGLWQSSVAHNWSLNLNSGSTLRAQSSASASQNTWNGPVAVNGQVTLLAEGVLNFGNTITGTANVTKTGGSAATISSPGSLSNTGNVVVSGGSLTLGGSFATDGDLTLSGGSVNINNTSSFTGATTLNAGTLTLNYATDDNGKLPDDQPLTLGGGTISLTGGTHVEAVASTTLLANTLSTVSVGSHSGWLDMKTITRQAGAAVNFSADYAATTDNANSDGILGPWATVAGNNWAVNDSGLPGGDIIAFTDYVYTFDLGDDASLYENEHVVVDTSQAPDAAISPRSLVFNAAVAPTLTLQGSNTLSTGGILVGSNVGNNASIITGGDLTGPNNGDLVINQRNTANALTIGSSITNNGATSLLKTGPGTAILTAANSYSGTTNIVAGSLQINNASAIGGSQIITSGSANAGLVLNDGLTAGSGKTITIVGGGASEFFGALSTNGSATWQGDAVIGAATGARLGTLGSGTLTFAGNISEPLGVPSQLLIRPNSGGAVVLSGNNTHTGGTHVVLNSLRLGSNNALGSGPLTMGGGGNATALTSDGSTPRTIANPVTFDSTATHTLGNSTLDGKLTFTGPASLGGATRTLGVASTVEFSNAIGATGAFGIVKSGTGDLILSAANTYTGSTQINGGTLIVAHKDALATNSSVFPSTPSGSGTLRLATDESVVINRIETSSSNPGTVVSDRATPGAGINHVIPTLWAGANTYTFAAGPNVTSGTAGITFNAVNLTAGSPSTAVLNPTTAVLTVNGPVNIGLNSQAKTLRLDGSSSGNLISGVVSNGLNTVTVQKTGTSTWELSGVNSYTGTTTVSNGTLTLSGNRTATSATITVGNTAGQTGILEIKGDLPVGTSEFGVGATAANATGIVNHSAGLVSFTGGNALLIGRTVGNVSGTYNLSGGELRTFISTSRGVMIGVNDGTAGNLINATFNLSGSGFLNNSTGTLQVVRGDNTSSYQNSAYHQTGGTSTNGHLVIGGGIDGAGNVNAGRGANSIAVFTVTGGTFSTNNFAGLSRANNTTSTINIGGTADVTLPAFPVTRGTSSTATLYFDGGTLKPAASSASYISGLTNAFIKSGGATLDTNGFSVTISQNLLTDPVSTGGGLTKQGVGTLALTGSNTYTGNTAVTAGTLSLGNGTTPVNLANSADVSVASGSVINLNYSGTDVIDELSLGGVPQPAGVYDASHPSGLITGTGSLTVNTGPAVDDYSAWADSFDPAVGAKAADDDGDGLTNFEEYAFGLDPRSGSSVNPITQPLDKTTGVFKYTRRATPATSGVVYTYESSTDLIGIWPGFTPDSTVSNNATPVEEITVTVPATLLANPRIFLRVRAEEP